MGLFSALSRLSTRKPAAARRRTLGKFEQMEPRQMMAGDVAPQILLGAVYFEEATGDDTKGDVIEVSYVGGAAGTTLDRLTINGDKDGDGRSNGDVFFDIAAGGWGAFESVPLSIQQQVGFTITGVTVVDGGMSIVFDLEGFDAGEKLVFSIDVDEVGSASRGTSNALAEGGEFEFSKLTGEFSAVGYRDLTLNGEFLDAFDPARTAAQTATGLTLDLPNDRYALADNKIDRTAGAVAYGPQVPLALISGYVYHDRDDDGVFDRTTGEEGIAGVTLELLDANGVGTGVTTVTGPNGFYEFRNLEAGVWGVREVQPVSWLDGKDTVGDKGGLVAANDKLTGATLAYGDHGKEYNFGELKPASIGGRVGAHKDGDCDFDEPDVPLAGVQIDLLDGNGVVIRTTTTDSEGRYKFEGLTPGTYSIVEHQPTGYYDGPERAGSAGGVVTNDKVSSIYLGSDVRAVNYDFCEHIGANLSGYVYHDRDDDGVFDSTTGEEPIAGVTLKLLRADGSDTGQRALTDANGYYEFTNLDAGTYAVAEVQPTGWLDGKDTPGNLGGTAALGVGADQLSGIVIVFGQDGVQYNFGELKPASIRGKVGAHKDGDCDFDEPSMPLSGVRIELLDASGILISFTTTNAQGEYAFEGLRPGTYQIREIQPTGFYDGPERAGSAGGTVSNDLISAIYLGSDVNAINYDFCEHIGSNLSGYVYHDRDDDGVFDRDTEEPIAGVVLKLLRGDGTDTGLRATTIANGYYQFTNLDAGTYIVMEVQPAGWVDGKDTPGNLGGIADTSLNGDMIREIVLTFGADGVEYNFGELKLGSISGRVHQSLDPNCEVMPGDPPIAGVKIELLNAQGAVIATTFTNANGEYRFDGLRPGTYGVRETQPAGYFDGFDTIGSGGGVKISNDNIIDIPIRSDEHLIHYDFCEVIPAKLSGYVFIDGAPITTLGPLPADLSGIRDGQRTPDDTPLAGVWLELRPTGDIDPIYGTDTRYVLAGTYGPGPIRVQTDANGYYEFTGLAAAVYTVVQIQPPNLIDGIDTPGTLGGQAINLPPAPGPGGLTPIDQFLVDSYGTNVIKQIALTPGANSQENNFSEVRQQPLVLPPPPTTPLPPPTPPTNPLAFRNPLLPGLVPPPRAPEDIFGGSSAVGYTWHLSVVNAGQPRAMTMKQLAKQFSTARFDAASWEQKRLDGAEWTLMTDANQGERTERFFGDPNGIPVAGDWNGDGVTDIGVFIDGEWLLDLNGNGKWDRGDLWAQLGSRDDQPVTGDWDGDGKTDIGIYGPAWPRDPHAIEREPGLPDADNHPSRLADKYKNVPPTEEDRTSGARVLRRTARGEERADKIDHVFHYGTPGDAPVAGDWNGDGIRAIGIFRDGVWTLDLNGDGVFDEADSSFSFGQTGDLPIVGDFDGDGVADLAVYRAGRWIVDTNGDRALDARDRVFELGGADSKPITGDWDGDGDDDPAVVTPRIARKSA